MDIEEIIRLTKREHNSIDEYYLSSVIATILDLYNDDNINNHNIDIIYLNNVWDNKYKNIYNNSNFNGHFIYRDNYPDTNIYYDEKYLCKLYYGENAPNNNNQKKICDNNEEKIIIYGNMYLYLFESLLDHISIKIITLRDICTDNHKNGLYMEINDILDNFDEIIIKWSEYYKYVKKRYDELNKRLNIAKRSHEE